MDAIKQGMEELIREAYEANDLDLTWQLLNVYEARWSGWRARYFRARYWQRRGVVRAALQALLSAQRMHRASHGADHPRLRELLSELEEQHPPTPSKTADPHPRPPHPPPPRASQPRSRSDDIERRDAERQGTAPERRAPRTYPVHWAVDPPPPPLKARIEELAWARRPKDLRTGDQELDFFVEDGLRVRLQWTNYDLGGWVASIISLTQVSGT